MRDQDTVDPALREEHCYPGSDPEEGLIYVREWSDEQLMEEWLFLATLTRAVASEVAFRADHPEYRDGASGLTAGNVKAAQAADVLADFAEPEVNTRADINRR